MKPFLAIDTETCLFSPGNMAPPLVCISWYDGKASGLVHVKDAKEWITDKIKKANKDNPLVLQNAAYDTAVLMKQYPDLMKDIFDLYDRDGIVDTKIREKLIQIARGNSRAGRYSLKDMAQQYLRFDLDKSSWRYGYESLIDKPLEEWPEGAKDYAILDAVSTGKIYLAQDKNEFGEEVFLDQHRQTRADIALNLTSNHGIMTDAAMVDKLEKETIQELSELRIALIEGGLVKENGSRNMKAVEALMRGSYPTGPTTPTGRPKVDEETCQESGNELLKKLSRYRQLQTLVTKDVEVLKKGTDKPLHTRFNCLLDTGRTSSSGPNLQNPRREAGVRECYIPRPGYYFASCDYEAIELRTLAQVCLKLFGYSRLAEKLNAGFDPHLDFAAQLLGCTYEQVLQAKASTEVKEARQRAKVANFGFPGGMGVKKFSMYANRFGIHMTEEQAKQLKDNWFNAWPEMRDYFKWISSVCGQGNSGNISHLFSNRLRGNVRFTEACNSFFQGLAADGAKEALYEVIKKCFIKSESALYGSRPVNFVHDEIIVEVPRVRASQAAKELEDTMCDSFHKWTPDLKIKAESCLSEAWYKDAKKVTDQEGNLKVWKPQE